MRALPLDEDNNPGAPPPPPTGGGPPPPNDWGPPAGGFGNIFVNPQQRGGWSGYQGTQQSQAQQNNQLQNPFNLFRNFAPNATPLLASPLGGSQAGRWFRLLGFKF